MGNAESRQVPLECTDICLYKSEIENGGFSWILYGENVAPKFYNINEDIENSQKEWHLEFEGSVDYPDVLVDSQTQFSLAEQKCVFRTQTGEYWALSFPTPESFSQFSQQFNGYLFENTFQTPLNEEAVKKVCDHQRTLDMLLCQIAEIPLTVCICISPVGTWISRRIIRRRRK
jgi:hypothetical protein